MKLESKILNFSKIKNPQLIRDYFQALEKLSQLNLIPHSPNDFLENFIDCIANLLQCNRISVMLLDPVTEELKVRVYRGFSDTEVQKYRLKPGEGIAGKALLDNKVYIFPPKSPAFQQCNKSYHEPDATLYIPLAFGHEPRGVITVGSAQQKRFYTWEEVQVTNALATYITLAMESTRLNNEISSLSINFLKSLITAIEAKDPYTRMHSMRVTKYAVMTGTRMGMSQINIEYLRWGALLHDIGKIGINDAILLKPDKLTKKEMETIREHPVIGARILVPDGPLRVIVPLVLYHHERYDGQGYPQGLKGTDIPIGARIIAVADAFEAMTADRPYRKAFSIKKAVQKLEQNAGSQLDPEIVEVFKDMLQKNEGG